MAHLNLGPGEVRELASKAKAAIGKAKRLEAKAEEVVSGVVHTAEVAGAAFIAGLGKGWKGTVELFGVPAELLLAAGLHTAGYAGIAGSGSRHLHGFGDGFLASYMTEIGRGAGVGIREREKGAKAKGEALSDAELARLAQGA